MIISYLAPVTVYDAVTGLEGWSPGHPGVIHYLTLRRVGDPPTRRGSAITFTHQYTPQSNITELLA